MNNARNHFLPPVRIGIGGVALLAAAATILLRMASSGSVTAAPVTAQPSEAAEPVHTQAPVPPNFSVPALDSGRIVRLSDFHGKKAVLLDFYQNSCPTCRAEFPHLVALSKAYSGRGVQIIAVPLHSDRAAAGLWKRQFKAGFPFLYDPKFTMARDYHIQATPTVVVIDRTGNLAAFLVGPDAASLDQVVAAVASPSTVASAATAKPA